MEDRSPIEKLAALILNMAAERKADQVKFTLIDDCKLELKLCSGGDWMPLDPPPVYLWSNVRNLFLLWAGIEYWQSGAANGKIDQEDVTQKWNFSISEDHNSIEFELITNG